jgi:hypothetical protein
MLRITMRFLPLLLAAGSIVAADMQHVTILRDDTLYYITPWLTRLRNGDLVVTAREAYARETAQRGHLDPTARGVMVRSRDGGRTWSPKIVFDDETYRFSQTQDPPIMELSDGRLLVTLYSWSISPLPMGFPSSRRAFVATFEGLWTRASADGGLTWTPRRPVSVEGLPPLSARVPPVELPDGTLVMAVYDEGPKRSGLEWSRCWSIRSTDRGLTWGGAALIAEDEQHRRNFEEPSLLRLRNGKLLTMMRITAGRSPLWPDEKEGYLWQSESADGGRSWSKPVKTAIWGYPADVIELQDGRLLCVYGYRRKPYGLRAVISRDGGGAWDMSREIVLRDDGGDRDLGYPSSVEFPDGRVLTVYWIHHEKPGDPQSATRYVAGTFWRP